MSDALDPTRKEALSSHLDHENLPDSADTQDAASLIHESFSAQLHYRNLESVSRATQQAGAPVLPAPDFLSRIMGAIDGLEQEDPCDDFEVLSAWSDGEWELETVTETAEATRQTIRTLSSALAKLPTPAAPQGFADRVMAAVEQTRQPQPETLSALYDAETRFAEVRVLQTADLPAAAQTRLQNFKILSGALRRLTPPQAPSDFARRVMAALPQPSVTLESLSAHYDLEANLELPESPTLLQNFSVLSRALQALPQPEAPTGFAAGIMQRIESAEFEAVSSLHDGEAESGELSELQQVRLTQLTALSAGFAALPQVTAPADFAARVAMAIEADFAQLSASHDGEAGLEVASEPRLDLLVALSAGFAALPEVQAPAGFAATVMQAIDALPDFETLSAVFDGELQSPLKISDQQLQPLRALSSALAALPQPEAPNDFVARVMLATEQSSKRQLFALPKLFQTRLVQVAAGFAIFGIIATVSFNLINQPIDPGTDVAQVPVVQVQYAPEDMLFSNPKVRTVMDDTLEVENSTENDYNLWIGG